jgi:hypothetical protein
MWGAVLHTMLPRASTGRTNSRRAARTDSGVKGDFPDLVLIGRTPGTGRDPGSAGMGMKPAWHNSNLQHGGLNPSRYWANTRQNTSHSET